MAAREENADGQVEQKPLQASPSACSTETIQDSDDSLSGTSDQSESPLKEEEEAEQEDERAQDGVPAAAPEPAPVNHVESGRAKCARVALWCFHIAIFTSCVVGTALALSFRRVLTFFMCGSPTAQKLHRPKAHLSWEKLRSSKDPVGLAREVLPTPPPFPEPDKQDFTITFAPCANLMIYTGGVACCLRRCPNYREIAPKIRFYGNSCGAFVASVMAADLDMLEFLPEMLSWTERYRGRLWGLVGAYSASITDIVWQIFSNPGCFQRARERLSIGVTTFSPMPGRLSVDGFDTAEELVTTLLGSCYIPVAFEVPQWSAKHGPLWDGGIFDFACQGDVVISPYECVLPEVCPDEAYPKSFSFFPPHEADAVTLFEEGYMDCLRWLQNGAPSRAAEREEAFADSGADHGFGNMGPLLSEGKRFIFELFRGQNYVAPVKAPTAADAAKEATPASD